MLSGNEYWVREAMDGNQIYASDNGIDWWWPVYDIELDCELVRIDVMGKLELWQAGECYIRVGDDELITDIYSSAP